MAEYRSPNGKTIIGTLTLVKDDNRKIIIRGLAQSRQHYKLIASRPNVIDIKANPDNKKLEQSILLIPKIADTTVMLTPRDPKYPNNIAPGLSSLTIKILDRLALPMGMNNDQLLLFKVLMAEVLSVESANYDEELALKSMQWMRYTLKNRVELSQKYNLSSNQLGVPQGERTVTATIFYGNVIAGFAKGHIDPVIEKRIERIFLTANTSSYPNIISVRKLLNNAKSVATGILSGTDHLNKVYGWRTEGKGSPSNNFRLIESLQGQSFYTLSDDFLKSLKKK